MRLLVFTLCLLFAQPLFAGNEVGGDSGVRPGQADMDNSLPVTMANNQSPISITGTVLANNGSVGFTSAAVPNQSTFAGGEDPLGNLEGLKVDSLRSLIVNGSNYTQPISATSLPLPAGAATAAKQDVGNASAASIDGKITTTANGIKVDGSAVTQPVSGTVSATQGTSPWVTSRNWNLSNSTDSVSAIQGTSPWLTSRNWTLSSGTDSVAIAGTVAVTQSTSPWVVDGSGVTQPISAASLPLPAGASTAAKQDIGNTSLASIDGKIVTTAGGIKVDGSAVTQPVSGTVSATQGTSPWVTSRSWTLSNGSDSIASVESGVWSVRAQDGAGNALASSTTTPTGSEQALIVRNIASGTQTVSGTVAVTQSTSPWVTSRNWTLSSGTDSIAAVQSGVYTVQPGNTANTTPWLITINQGGNSAAVTGANALKVDGSAVTQPVSAASLPLPSGAATSANQTTEIASLQIIDDVVHATNDPLNKSVAIGGQLDDVSTTAATEDNVAAVRITPQRAQHMNLRSQAGTEIATASNPLRTDPTGSTTQPVSGTVSATQGTSPWVTSRNWTLASGTDSVASVQSGTWTVQPGNTANTTPWLSTINQGGNSATVTGANALKVDGSAVTQPVSGTVATTVTDTVPATQTITALDTATSSLAGANGQVFYFNTPTTNSAATFSVSGIHTVSVQASVLGSGTMVVEVSMDGGTFWLRPNVYQISTQNYTNGFTAPFIASVNVAGMTNIRVRSITSWSGTATIAVRETLNGREVTVADALPAGANVIGGVTESGTWTVQPGNTANTTPWLSTINQGGNSASVTASNALKVDGSAVTQPVSEVNRSQNIIANQTITSSGSAAVTLDPGPNRDIGVVIRINGAVTGTTPTLQFTLNDLDPQTNNILAGTSSQTYTAATTNTWYMHFTRTAKMQLNYTVTGTSPSFAGVYVTLVSLQGSTLRNSAGTEIGTNAAPVGVQIGDGTNQALLDNGSADGEATSQIGLYTNSRGYVFNGTTWDRWKTPDQGNNLAIASFDGASVGPYNQYNATVPTITDTRFTMQQANQFGALSVSGRWKFRNLTGNATTTVKSGTGTLHIVMINNNATGGTVTIYDNTAASGTLIGTFQVGSPTGGLLSTTGSPTPYSSGTMDVEFATGLTVVTAGSANNNVTISYQ